MDRHGHGQHHRLVTMPREGEPSSPAGLLSLAHLAFYAAVAHHLRCLNGFRSFLLSFFCYNRFGFDLVE
uniref:Uncharacterized protein n=1 Tax=Aegilops tauschii subsp. strangulata TaxID=200361 RepID=A0A453DJH7_AEGTS